MDPKKLIRDAEKVQAYLAELPDGRLVARKALKILIPSLFAERGLAEIGIETRIVGICVYIVEDKYYAISLVNAMFSIEPTSTTKVMIDDDEYTEFYFEPGSTVLTTLDLVRTDTLVYKIYDEIIAKGRVPWYISYSDLGKIFDTAKKHANANIGENHEVTEMMVSLIARSAADRHKYYRQAVTDKDYIAKTPPAFIALRSVTYAATNTTNKLAGSYFQEGVVSALNTPSTRVEKLESLLRA